MGNFKFELGDKLKDLITGFEGIVIGRTEWITGCNIYGIKSQILKDGLPTESQWLDDNKIVKVDDGLNIIKGEEPTGGP